uniref:Uncharacterized protein n=1 Tax=Glossina pallidipes TaxID=7398 RepID=A0A1A9ZFU1_GLOPL
MLDLSGTSPSPSSSSNLYDKSVPPVPHMYSSIASSIAKSLTAASATQLYINPLNGSSNSSATGASIRGNLHQMPTASGNYFHSLTVISGNDLAHHKRQSNGHKSSAAKGLQTKRTPIVAKVNTTRTSLANGPATKRRKVRGTRALKGANAHQRPDTPRQQALQPYSQVTAANAAILIQLQQQTAPPHRSRRRPANIGEARTSATSSPRRMEDL